MAQRGENMTTEHRSVSVRQNLCSGNNNVNDNSLGQSLHGRKSPCLAENKCLQRRSSSLCVFSLSRPLSLSDILSKHLNQNIWPRKKTELKTFSPHP